MSDATILPNSDPLGMDKETEHPASDEDGEYPPDSGDENPEDNEEEQLSLEFSDSELALAFARALKRKQEHKV